MLLNGLQAANLRRLPLLGLCDSVPDLKLFGFEDSLLAVVSIFRGQAGRLTLDALWHFEAVPALVNQGLVLVSVVLLKLFCYGVLLEGSN
jgi:hypothetical protein